MEKITLTKCGKYCEQVGLNKSISGFMPERSSTYVWQETHAEMFSRLVYNSN